MGSSKPEKKEKKDKKRSEVDGISKPKKDKKDKKEKKDKLKSAVNAALDDQLQADVASSVTVVKDDDTNTVKVLAPVVGALVPFALPLADEKATKKIMKSVRKGMSALLFIPDICVLHGAPSSRDGRNANLITPNSGETQDPQARRKRSRQVPT